MARLSLGSSLLFVGLAGALACTPRALPTAKQSGARDGGAAYRLAVAPVTLSPTVERREESDPTRYADAATHIGHYLAEALLERGVDVVPVHDSQSSLLDVIRSPDLHGDASRLARAAAERLRVDALLVVEITRWSPLDTSRLPPSAAEVGFRATLHAGLEGHLLWSGEFRERQISFFENPWRSLQYPGRGTRWLTVIELARWGAGQLAAQIPIGSVER